MCGRDYGRGVDKSEVKSGCPLLPPQGSGLRGGTPNVPSVKKKYLIVVLLVCENFLDLMKLGAHGGPG